jgi:hypothetical protein
VEQRIVLTRWAGKWLQYAFQIAVGNTPDRVVAKRLLAEFDQCEEEAGEFVDILVDTKTRTVMQEVSDVVTIDHVKTNVTTRRRIQKGRRSSFAMCIAKEAYLKFGARPVSEANVLVTRKWLGKLVDDRFKDLRTCDKVLAVDRATFLSFVPTMSWNNMKFLVKDVPFNRGNSLVERINGDSLFTRIGRWANPDD